MLVVIGKKQFIKVPHMAFDNSDSQAILQAKRGITFV